ncbi:hypothetical protein HUS23_13325 [Ectothiorhodospiraceae bacterium 2226]|nr:hypothetical protein HUS23_13325 [Ectothiorhodospiraceae bacterium 2226]
MSGAPVFVSGFRGARLRAILCAVLAALAAGPLAVSAESPAVIAEVRAVADTGAAGLALHLLDGAQARAGGADAWMALERERVRLLMQTQQWAALADRAPVYPDGVPAGFVSWARGHRAQALLRSNRPAEARAVLLQLMAQQPQGPQLGALRRQIAQSYLDEGRLGDAYVAMQRYRRDYGDDDLGTARLLGRLLLQQQQPREAELVLAPHAEDPEAYLLQLLASLRAETLRAGQVLARSLGPARQSKDEALRVLAWAVAAEAALAVGDLATAANGLEHVLAARQRHPLPSGLFDLSGETLWEVYVRHATALGNRAGRLVGDDARWLVAAREAERPYPVQARALTALLAERGGRAAQRAAAHEYLMRQVLARENGMVLLHALYLDVPRFAGRTGDHRDLPEVVRHTLIDHALAAGDLTLASRLSAHAAGPPPGIDPFMWHLRRARILISAGEAEAGAEALGELLAAQDGWSNTQIERTLQVVFDLQNAAQHEAALGLFEALYARAADGQVRREIHYWMADSQLALERPADAALLYMRSAGGSLDPWGQTALYQAAGALARARMVEDARGVYQRLLRITDDPARRAVLERELQQLGGPGA